MSLVLHYKVNSDATDASGNGLDGVATNGSFVAGKIGNAFDNEGNSWITRAYDAAIYLPTFTIAWWQNLQTVTYGSNTYPVAMYERPPGKRQWGFWIPSGGAKKYQINVSTNGTAAYSLATGITPVTGWHHMALTCVNSTKAWELFIDGVSVFSGTHTYSFANQGSHLTIGGQNGTNLTDGIYDDFRYYDEVLNLRSIQLLYADGDGTETAWPTWPVKTMAKAGTASILGVIAK